MRGLGCVGFNDLDILDEDDRVGKEEADRQQMRRDQRVCKKRSRDYWMEVTESSCCQTCEYTQKSLSMRRTEHTEQNGLKSGGKRLHHTAI